MPTFKVKYNDGKNYEYYDADTAGKALEKYAKDVGISLDEASSDAWVEKADSSKIDWEHEAEKEVSSKYPALSKVLASGRATAHCYQTWLDALKKLEDLQSALNNAMNMSAQESDLPVEMKAQLSSFVSQIYDLQTQGQELMEELREVDAGAPPPPPEETEPEEEV